MIYVTQLNGDVSSKSFLKMSAFNSDILNFADGLSDRYCSYYEYYGYGSSGAINSSPTNSNGIALILKLSNSFVCIIALPFGGGLYTRIKRGEWSNEWESH